MSARVTKREIHEETPFGTMVLSRDLPTTGRLFGFETHNMRLFLGRTRVPPARTDLRVQFDQLAPQQRPLLGFASVLQILTLADRSVEQSRLAKFAVYQGELVPASPSKYTLSKTHRHFYRLFELVSLDPVCDLEPAHDEYANGVALYKSARVSDLLAVALLTAAG